MAGTSAGAAKAVAKMLEKNPDHFRTIGSLGGKAPTSAPKGFAANRDIAVAAGRLGGQRSKRKPRADK